MADKVKSLGRQCKVWMEEDMFGLVPIAMPED